MSSADDSLVILDVLHDTVLACQRNVLKNDKIVIGKVPRPGEEENIVWNDLTESKVVAGLEQYMFNYIDLKGKGDFGKSITSISNIFL